MAKTVEWAVATDENVLRAVELRARREGGTASEVVEALLRQALAPEMDELAGAVPLAALLQTVIRRHDRAAHSTAGPAPR